MKKIFTLIFAAMTCILFSSCVTTMAAEPAVATTVEYEYYDYETGRIIVYIDGIASYRFWDNVLLRYYYRPVPHDRFGYIHRRPIPHHHHHPGPVHRPHHPGPVQHHPNVHHPSTRPQNPHSDMRGGRPTTPPSSTRHTVGGRSMNNSHSSSRGSFGGSSHRGSGRR